MRRLLSLIVLSTMAVLAMSGCSGQGSASSTATDSAGSALSATASDDAGSATSATASGNAGTSASTTASGNTESQAVEAAAIEITSEQQVIYDENGVKITLTGFGSDLGEADSNVIVVGGGAWLDLTVENNTGDDIYVGCPYAMVNGLMVDTFFQCYPTAGETLEGQMLEFDYDTMVDSNISTIKDMRLVIIITDMTKMTSIDTKYIRLATSAKDYEQPVYKPQGAPLMDAAGVKAYYLGSEYDGSAYIYSLYLVNNGTEMVSVGLRNAKADGDDVSGYTYGFNCDLLPNASAFGKILVQTDESGYSGPQEIKVLSGDLAVYGLTGLETDLGSAEVSFPQKSATG